VAPSDANDSGDVVGNTLEMPLSTTCATLAAVPPLPVDLPPIVCPTVPSVVPSARVDAARPASCLPQPPTLFTYDVGLGSVDIGDLFHCVFTTGTAVTHQKKQERGRLRAVVNYAQTLLRTSTDTTVKSIAARLSVAPVSPSSAAWPEWTRAHREACAELKAVVVNAVSAEGPDVLSTSVSSIGSRILRLSAEEVK